MSYTRALRYKGDLVHTFHENPGKVYGPSEESGEYFEFASGAYDSDKDITTVLFRSIPRRQGLQRLLQEDGENLKKMMKLQQAGLIE
ncbi:hypothetical protein BJD55_gp087 [Gordonia phage Yvonnetastic]|uniref:Uncharacterized protein n=1 Tax=Gordonia phage Yvonnetastic TaxID=1821566 RepID=A0A142K996_9CAUD|nr:hypothetical protein BJD55_gp087 [Gordonia phage Yvonnetastic]AMS02679.1 hypothetical protein SEA_YVONNETASTIC_135 [Gordonia phage Yvonnetastic]